MIMWINGAFGVGKTTTARTLLGTLDGWRLFDPEEVGVMLRTLVPDLAVSDFQDLPLWRSLVPRVAMEVQEATSQHLLAVQTVLDQRYWSELRAGFDGMGTSVLHIVLDADSSTLEERIGGDAVEIGARGWRLKHIERFEEARSWLLDAADLVIDTDRRTPEQVAGEVLNFASGYQ